MVKFANWTADETPMVEAILERALSAGLIKDTLAKRSLEMDLSATHATNPLDVAKLRDADAFNFAHDIRGIMRHLDRRTGRLTGCFDPRCSVPNSVLTFDTTTFYEAGELADDDSWQQRFIARSAYGSARFTSITRTPRGAIAGISQDGKRKNLLENKMFMLEHLGGAQ